MFDAYSSKSRTYITQSMQHVFKVEIADRELELESGFITWDEARTPHVTFEGTAKVPEDQAYLDSLDPRLKPRVYVYLGYVYPGGETDLPLVANLSLSSRSVVRPDNTIDLVAESDEVLVGEYGRIAPELSFGTSFSPITAIQTLITTALPSATVNVTATRENIVTDPEQPYTIKPGEDPMRAVVDLADQAGSLWVYDDGLRTWHIQDRAEIGSAAHNLTVNANGTVLSSRTTMSRENWGNAILVHHTWRDADGTELSADGYAEVTSGPYAVATVGRTLFVVERSTPISLANADTAAVSILRRVTSRGRSFELDAISYYPLRPGDTVTVQLPEGPQERVLVAGVRFHIPDGRMSVVTRLPEDADPS